MMFLIASKMKRKTWRGLPLLSETQVIVLSRWDRSPAIMEDQVTYPRSCADFRLGRASIFSAVIELWVRHSSATIPLRVSLFLLEMPSAAARTSFS